MAGKFMDLSIFYLQWVEYNHLLWRREVGQVRGCISELRFLKMCIWWFERWDKDDCGQQNFQYLKCLLHIIGFRWEALVGALAETLDKFQLGDNFRARTIRIGEVEMDYKEQERDDSWIPVMGSIQHWRVWSSKFEEAIEESKIHITQHCPHLLHCKFNNRSMSSADQVLKFLDAILIKLKVLVNSIKNEVVPLKNQIQAFEKKLMLLHAFFKLIPDDCSLELRDFKKGLYNDINKVAWLTFSFWAKVGDEKIASELNLKLSDISRKVSRPPLPDGPDVASWYLRALKAMRLHNSDDALLLGQAVPGFLDLMFEYQGVSFNENFQLFRDGLIILFTFLANPPEEYSQDEELLFICDQLGEFVCLVVQVNETEKNSSKKEVNSSDFVSLIERLKGKIRKLHNCVPDSSSYNMPRTNCIGFIDYLLQNLQENLNSDKMLVPFLKHIVIKIEQELVSLRPDLDDIFELQKEQNGLQDTWLQLIKLAYLTEHIVNSCSVILYPIWYNMVCLDDILDEIKVIKGKVDIVKCSNVHNAAVLIDSVGSSGLNEIQARPSQYSGGNEVMVGFEKEVAMIVDQLTRGPKSLEIVSIVGMGGSGKTTLARKVYESQQVRSFFHIFAFCNVSQVYSTRELLLEVLRDINGVFVDDNSKTADDLAHLLHKQLSGKTYLIVIDDIWKIDAWEKVKSSFPNDNDGSRIIFTTRESEVATKARSKIRPHSKKLFSDEESWELLQLMVFPQDDCPPNLSEVGQMIVKNCGGLPLAVSVIGRLLQREERSLRLWNEVAEKTSSIASEEGCLKVLELSYQHLPEHLKSCFLYLGVFGEDELIPAKRLILLWIAEGLVQTSHTESLEIVAKVYLSELIDRSLVQLAKRSSSNGIKSCQLHDVIRDFCRRKAQEENFFQQIHGVETCKSSLSNRYRLCIQMGLESFVEAELKSPGTKSLLYNDKQRFFYGCDSSKFDWAKYQLIQVLDLEKVELRGIRGEVDKIIENMISLVHLRYLAVSIGDADIGIPSGMADLKNLETLILRRRHPAGLSWWSETFWRMEKLRHLDVGSCYLIPCAANFEAYSPMYNLECFSTLVLKPDTARMLLQMLPNVRKLSCIYSSFSNDSILALDVLTKLESLKLRVYGENVILPSTLKKLYLHGSGLSSQLGKLPCLEVLKIHGYVKFTWDIEDEEFPELKFLKLENSTMREWNALDGSFPRLEQLVLVDCQELLEIPACFRESTTLKRIEVRSCRPSLASSAREIRDEQNDLGNEIQLIITDPRD